MIILKTVINVKGLSAKDVVNFMLNCTDADYQRWWPRTHLAFHTIKHYPGSTGDLVYFDEYVGGLRLKFKAVVSKVEPEKEIVWQMKKLIKLPVRLSLR